MSTAILSVTYRISSELRSQATAGLVSTTVGDHVGIRGAVGSLFFSLDFFVHVFSCGGESREKPEGDPRLPLRLQSGANACNWLAATGKTDGRARVRRGNEYKPVRLIFNGLASV